MILKNSSKILCAMLGLLMVVSLVPTVSAGAGVPTWENGQEWAWGGKVYLDLEEGDMMDQIESVVEGIPGATLDDIYMNGSLEAYVYCHVLNQTSSDYIVEMVFAVELIAEANVEVSALLQKAGTYGLTDEVPMEQKTISMDADIDYLVFERFTMIVEKSTLAIKEATSLTEMELELDFSMTNFPEQELEGYNKIFSYTSYDVNIDLDMALNLTVTFDPYMDLYDFPIEVGEEWLVSTQTETTGSLEGTYSAYGLPDDLEAGLFQPDNGQLTNPLDLSTYTGDLGDFHITNGVVDPVNEYLSASMHCVSMSEIDNPELGMISVYVINVDENEDGDPVTVIYYSPDIKFFSSIEATTAALSDLDLGDISEVSPIGLIPTDDLAMDYIEPEEAVENIESISGQSVFGEPDGGNGGPTGGSNDMTMIFAVVMIAIVLVAILGAVLVLRKKKV